MMRRTALTLVIVFSAGQVIRPHAQSQPAATATSPSAATALQPTDHPKLPRDLSQLWLAPAKGRTRSVALDEFASGVKLEVAGDFAKALPIFSKPSEERGPLSAYAELYKGLALLRLGRAADARATFQALQAREPVGYVAEAALLREAECDEALGEEAAAFAVYQRLSMVKTTAPDDVLLRMAKAAKSAGNAEQARAAYTRLYYEFPFSDLATIAANELDDHQPIVSGSNRYRLELGRAERLFSAKKYAQARAAFETLRGAAQGDDRELVNLRLAESDYFLKRARNARDGVRPYTSGASRQAEALFFYAIASRDLGDRDEYFKTIRRIADEFPTQSWAEEALNNLGTQSIIDDDDEGADQAFREVYEKYPNGRYAERAAWKIGWRAYRSADYGETVRVFERAAADFPRSDYRPAWVYWAGRAHEALGEIPLAQSRYNLVALDYLNSYYGRLAAKRLDGNVPERRLVASTARPQAAPASGDEAATAQAVPANAAVVRALLGLQLYDQALDELHYAQRTWGDSPSIQATIAWIYRQLGQTETGTQQFNHYRGAITLMRRAYPQFMAAGGESLPRDILKVIFPIGYWDLIKKYSSERDLDPYFVAALMAQESTFVANIESPARAVGLMQLEAATAKRYARKLGIRYSSRTLTNPEMNIRIGTAYLADQVREFNDLHLVLASYNAGEGNVRRWMAEREGLPHDVFIDDIPFPETQNYVKKILGTAEDYRRLYGPGAGASADDQLPEARPASAVSVGRQPAAPKAAKKPAATKSSRKRRHTT